MSDSSSFKIHYYADTGRGHPLRVCAVLAGISFEDVFESMQDQIEKKKNGKRRWSGPPELTILDKNGKDLISIGQSGSILRYIGM